MSAAFAAATPSISTEVVEADVKVPVLLKLHVPLVESKQALHVFQVSSARILRVTGAVTVTTNATRPYPYLQVGVVPVDITQRLSFATAEVPHVSKPTGHASSHASPINPEAHTIEVVAVAQVSTLVGHAVQA